MHSLLGTHQVSEFRLKMFSSEVSIQHCIDLDTEIKMRFYLDHV